MAIIEGWLPPSREHWESVVFAFQLFPLVSPDDRKGLYKEYLLKLTIGDNLAMDAYLWNNWPIV